MSYCKARRSDGQPCRGQALSGATVCIKHGASAPQVREAARQRLLEMVNPALARLRKLIDADEKNVSLGAVKDVLDRAGYKPSDRIEHTGPGGGPVQIAVIYKNADGSIADADEEDERSDGRPRPN